MAAAHRHVRVAWGDPLSRAGAWQVVVVAAAGVVTGDGGEGVQGQILVLQTAGGTDRQGGQTERDRDRERERQRERDRLKVTGVSE